MIKVELINVQKNDLKIVCMKIEKNIIKCQEILIIKVKSPDWKESGLYIMR